MSPLRRAIQRARQLRRRRAPLSCECEPPLQAARKGRCAAGLRASWLQTTAARPAQNSGQPQLALLTSTTTPASPHPADMTATLTDTLSKLDLAPAPSALPSLEPADGGSAPSSGLASVVDSDAEDDPSPGGDAAGKKKKKKKPKKKKAAAAPGAPEVQSEPPRVGLRKIFVDGVFPVGEVQEYGGEACVASLARPSLPRRTTAALPKSCQEQLSGGDGLLPVAFCPLTACSAPPPVATPTATRRPSSRPRRPPSSRLQTRRTRRSGARPRSTGRCARSRARPSSRA